MPGVLNVAVEGCCHGELDKTYDSVRNVQKAGKTVDLLLICGDFQCVRHDRDFESVSVPFKYRVLRNFQDYVNGKKVAPVMTIFIGGNHEASNILQSLYYGGFVAPNMYFLGFAGSVWYKGIRISGLSGIFNEHHYFLGRYESPPYSDSSLRSIYHIREVEVYRMAHLKLSSLPIDIFLSHDWPTGITEFGNKEKLLGRKPYLRKDIDNGKFGSPPFMHLLRMLQPSYWFAAHHHVKFSAVVPHQQSTSTKSTQNDLKTSQLENFSSTSLEPEHMSKPKITQFLALDKVMPGREFIEFLSIPQQNKSSNSILDSCRLTSLMSNDLIYDIEWLAVLRRTHHLTITTRTTARVPNMVEPITSQELSDVDKMIRQENNGELIISNIDPAPVPMPEGGYHQNKKHKMVSSGDYDGNMCEPVRMGNLQTDFILKSLQLPHICTVPFYIFRSMQNTMDESDKSSFTYYSADFSTIEIPVLTDNSGIKKDENEKDEVPANFIDPNEISLDG